MSSITVSFEFEIGDIVFFRCAQHDMAHRPKQFIVVERIAQQCPGGIQKLYKLGELSSMCSEIQLSRDEPQYRPVANAGITEAANAISDALDKKRSR